MKVDMNTKLEQEFDKIFPKLWKENPPWSSVSPESAITCSEDVKAWIDANFISRHELAEKIEGLPTKTALSVEMEWNDAIRKQDVLSLTNPRDN